MLNNPSLVVLLKALSVAGVLAFAGPTWAQDASDQSARYEQAEAFRTGTSGAVDLQRAQELHAELVGEGYVPSMARLGGILEDAGAHRQALDAYEQGAEAGNAYAALRLAAGNARGRFGPLSDEEAGFAQLKAIVDDGGSQLARFYLGDAYARGYGTQIDERKAKELYEALASEGHPLATARLAQIAYDGGDRETAIDMFQTAVNGGYEFGRISLSRTLVEEGRGAEALPVIEAAMALGTKQAAARHAIWHYEGGFGAASDRGVGAARLKELSEAGDTYAARSALINHERRSRRIKDLDLPLVLSKLESSADDGDGLAAASLARAYRELSWLIPASRDRHSKLVADHSDILGVRNEVPEQLEVIYDPNNHAPSRKSAYEFLQVQSGDAFVAGLMRLRQIERRAFIYAVQNELALLGYFKSSASAKLTRSTVNAIKAFCLDTGINDRCKHGPLTYDGSLAIAEMIGAKRTPS